MGVARFEFAGPGPQHQFPSLLVLEDSTPKLEGSSIIIEPVHATVKQIDPKEAQRANEYLSKRHVAWGVACDAGDSEQFDECVHERSEHIRTVEPGLLIRQCVKRKDRRLKYSL